MTFLSVFTNLVRKHLTRIKPFHLERQTIETELAGLRPHLLLSLLKVGLRCLRRGMGEGEAQDEGEQQRKKGRPTIRRTLAKETKLLRPSFLSSSPISYSIKLFMSC